MKRWVWVLPMLLSGLTSVATAQQAHYAYSPDLRPKGIKQSYIDLSAAPATANSQRPFVWHGGDFVSLEGVGSASTSSPQPSADGCTVVPVAVHGWPIDNAFLRPRATLNPATINASGTIGSIGEILETESVDPSGDRVIYSADSEIIHSLVYGCGRGGSLDPPGGCGDPAPTGGTIGGLFQGTFFVPAINDAGDVLFLADIDNGPSVRGLFLYRGATETIDEVAAIGDLIPGTSDTIATIGPGSVNDHGEVVFPVEAVPLSYEQYILHWENGNTSVILTPGMALPGGGEIYGLYGEWIAFSDELWIPVGPLPDINDEGEIAFLAGSTVGDLGLFLLTADGIEVITREWGTSHTPVPFEIEIWAPVLTNSGSIAFLATDELGSAWYIKEGTTWRRAIGHYDVIDGGKVWGIAVSRNPMQPLNDEGYLVAWVALQFDDGSEQERLMLVKPDGELVTIVAEGDPSPFGGTYWTQNAWPSLNASNVSAIGARSIGGPESGQLIAYDCDVTADVDGIPDDLLLQVHPLQIVPNPSRELLSFDLTIEEDAGFARIRVFDVGGRHVHTVFHGRLAAGLHSWTWNGRTNRGSGALVGAGTYLAILELGGRRSATKFQITR